ncbi:helix-turn-helix domain-containing protein [Nocardia thailandica]
MAAQQVNYPQDELAERLRKIQELSGLGVRALARDTGISSSSLSRYLTAQTVPPWPVVVELCKFVRRDPRPLRPLWERAATPLAAPPKTSRQVQPPSPPPGVPRPPRNDLPRDVTDFTGRGEALGEVLDTLGRDRIVAIDGMAGVGKTCLAVHAAHRLTADYPDAQLYLDLHGFTEGRAPLDADTALRSLLAALEVPSERVPQDRGVEGLAACWRSELAALRAVVVLDNAADAEQVRPLLPGAGPSVTLITSRTRLLGLDQVPPVSLDVLSAEESAELLARASGEDRASGGRLARDPEAAAEVLRLCGHLPLALRLAAARLRHRPGWTVGILVERMSEGSGEFDAALGMSVHQLDRTRRRLFRLLGLLPGSSFDDYVVAALTELPLRRVRDVLEDLLDAHLVQQPAPGRFRLHDLVHQYARRSAYEQDSAEERARALGRALDYYVHAAAAADRAMPFLSPSRPPTAGTAPAALPDFPDKLSAFLWYRTEYTTLLAAFDAAVAAGAHTHVVELPRFMRAYFARRCGTTRLNVLFERSLAAAENLGDPLPLAEAHSDLGFARYNAGRMAEAAAAYGLAGPLMTRAGDRLAEAELTMRRGYLCWDAGSVDEPLDLFRLAARRYAEAGCPSGAAHATASEAWAMLQLGRRAEAADLARSALTTPPASLTAHLTLGVALAEDDPATALTHLDTALTLAREDAHKHNEAWCLNCQGVALRSMGRLDEALERHRAAFELLDELFEEQWKIHFLNAYAETCRLAGLEERAVALYRETLALAPSSGHRFEQAGAHEGLAGLLAVRDPAAAEEHRARAAALRDAPLAPA